MRKSGKPDLRVAPLALLADGSRRAAARRSSPWGSICARGWHCFVAFGS